MDTVIAMLSMTVALVGVVLQIFLLFEGLSVLGSLLLPFLSKEKAGWFSLWGGWYFVVFGLLLKFAHDTVTEQQQIFQKVAFELEGLEILAKR
jgi:hypothetical protein